MAQKKTTQKSTSVGEFHLKDILALSLSAAAVLLAGYQVHLAIKQDKQNSKQ
jgi:hypothetical protein